MKFLWYLIKNLYITIRDGLSGGSTRHPDTTAMGVLASCITIAGMIMVYVLLYLFFRKKKKYEAGQASKKSRKYFLIFLLLFCLACIIGELLVELLQRVL